MSARLSFTALDGVPEVRPGDDLLDHLASALRQQQSELRDRDVVVFCQKIVSKAENRYVTLASVEPTARAMELAAICEKDPRLVELALRESSEVLRCVKDVLILRHRLGFVVANAAIDQSNIVGGAERALLLPKDPDRSAERLRQGIRERFGREVAVLISDSFGRPWRMGVTGVCIGCAGLQALVDERGKEDRFGRVLKVTQIAIADELAAAATLVMGEADEGRPIAVISGLNAAYFEHPQAAARLVRAPEMDLFK